MTPPNMDRYLRDLETTRPSPAFRRAGVVEIVAELMELTYRSTDQDEKVRLAVLELRARALLERWGDSGQN
jgi:hypothetical protein